MSWPNCWRRATASEAVVRSPSKSAFSERKYTSEASSGKLSFAVVPDIQAFQALASAVADVDYICHLASAYTTVSTNPIKELVEQGRQRHEERGLLGPPIPHPQTPDHHVVLRGRRRPLQGRLSRLHLHGRRLGSRGAGTGPEQRVFGLPCEQDVRRVRRVRDVEGGLTELGPHRLLSADGVRPSNSRAAARIQAGTSQRFLLCGGVDNFEHGLAGLRARGETGPGEPGEKIDRSKQFSLDRSTAETALGMKFIPFEKTVDDVWARTKELEFVGA